MSGNPNSLAEHDQLINHTLVLRSLIDITRPNRG